MDSLFFFSPHTLFLLSMCCPIVGYIRTFLFLFLLMTSGMKLSVIVEVVDVMELQLLPDGPTANMTTR